MIFSLAQRYEVSEIIGNGGMSDVYAAEDTLLGRDVAVKMLRPEMARDVNFRERFRREARNSSRLNHPNIVAVYDTGEETIDGVGIPYIIMERIHGRTLRDITREDGPMSPREAAETIQPVCAALQASHDAGIIHRDIKPANIMLTNTGMVKVMDFGIARALDDSTSAMTQTSAVIGTAQYLSPEQARGKNADARSDVYALGCVLYEAVTGHAPFQGETPFAVAYQHVQEEPTPPSQYLADSDLTPTGLINLDAVVLTAMAKHPGDRYQSAKEMGQDLEYLARGSVTQAARAHVSPPSEQATHTTVEPALAGAGAGAAANSTALATPAAAAEQSPPAQTSGEAASDHQKQGHARRLRWLVAFVAVALLAIGTGFAYTVFNRGNDDSDENVAANETVTIPDIIGVHRDEAVATLEQLGLRADVVEAPDPEVPRDHVLRTNPTVGSQLQRNTSVTVTVSSGQEMTNVPDLTNQTPQQAATALGQVGLELDQSVSEEYSDSVAEGRIISHNPPAGTELSKGSRVHITVSLGEEITEVRVPSLSGMKWEQARQTLESLGFVPQPDFVDSLEPADDVLSVDGANEMRREGSQVRVEVSNGALFNMPDLHRKNRSQALEALRDAGWDAPDSRLVAGEPVDTGVVTDEGLIAATTPKAGEVLHRNDEITVRYWEFDLRSLVP